MRAYDAVVIGAGHNGLVTAGYLAKAGLSVLVLERLDKVGGACTTEELFPGVYGPACARNCDMLQAKVIDDLELRDHGFEIAETYASKGQGRPFRPFPDGAHLGGPYVDTTGDLASQIRRLSRRDAAAVPRWEAFWDAVVEMLAPYYMTGPPTIRGLVEETRSTALEDTLDRLLTWSLVDLVEHYFEDERVRAYFMSPSESDPSQPGSILSLAFLRCGSVLSRSRDKGVPVGGMGSITRAMASAAQEFGAAIRTGAVVDRVIVEDGAVSGVRLSDGEEIGSRIVVSNADPKRTFSTLVSADEAPADVRRARAMTARVSSLVLSVIIGEIPDFGRYLGNGYDRRLAPNPIMIGPSVQYYERAWRDTMEGRWPRSPIMTVRIPSAFDPTYASDGPHLLTVWSTYQPARLVERSWDEVRQEVADNLIGVVDCYFPGFRDSIVDWELQTPEDIQARTWMTAGNIHHIDATPDQLGRQPYRSQIKGLYMCGVGTHPGGEVTGAPGHNCAKAILTDLSNPV